jgi:hypothetical protein
VSERKIHLKDIEIWKDSGTVLSKLGFGKAIFLSFPRRREFSSAVGGIQKRPGFLLPQE